MVLDDSQAKIQKALGDKYEIKQLIQAGGMGKIFLGIHKALDKKVAIKIIHQELVANEQIKSRFFREAKLAANLDHSGIIDIYDFGSKDGFDYIIMPFIEGETLEAKIKELGAYTPEEGIRIIIEIAEALNYAHTHNVIHRDIKPSNIMFDRQGKVIIADFGISKDMSDSDLTAPNTVLGSPRYMSPEQIKGQNIDGRSDLYSLGLMFYEMMTATHPFSGKDSTAIYYAQAHEIPPRPETQKPDIPRNIGAIIMKLLDKNPESRYADGKALIKDLQDHLEGNFSAGSDVDDDATIIDDATLIDDATMVMGDIPANHDEQEPYDDATVVAPLTAPPIPFYKKHFKVLAGAGITFFMIIFLFSMMGSDPSDETPSVQKETVTTQTAEPGADSVHSSKPSQDMPVPFKTEVKAELTETINTTKPQPLSIPDAIFSINGGKTADNFSLWTDSDTYRIGEAMNFHFESKKPCYAVILGYTTQKELIQIFPNHYASGQFIQPNRTYSIPDEQMEFDLQVYGPPGQETVIALVSNMPFNLFEPIFNEDNPFLSFNEQEMDHVTDFNQHLENIREKDISQQRLVYHIIN